MCSMEQSSRPHELRCSPRPYAAGNTARSCWRIGAKSVHQSYIKGNKTLTECGTFFIFPKKSLKLCTASGLWLIHVDSYLVGKHGRHCLPSPTWLPTPKASAVLFIGDKVPARKI